MSSKATSGGQLMQRTSHAYHLRSDWLITSGMTGPGVPQGHLYAVNARDLLLQ